MGKTAGEAGAANSAPASLERFTLEIVYSDFLFKAVPCVSFQEKGSLLSYTHKPKRFVLKARCAARLRASAAHPPEHFKCEML